MMDSSQSVPPVRATSVVLQQAFSSVVCFVLLGAALVAITIRFRLFDALRLSFDPLVSIAVTYFFVVIPALLISFAIGRVFYRAVVLAFVGIGTFVIANLPRIAL